MSTKAVEALDLQFGTTQELQIAGRAGRTAILLAHGLPGGPVQLTEPAGNAQPLSTGQAGRSATQTQFATSLQRLPRRSRKRQAGLAGVIQPVAPFIALQGHAPDSLATIASCLGKGRRQIDRQPLEVGTDAQLTVSAIQVQAQGIGQFATQRQGLGHAQPARQDLQGHPPASLDSCTRLAPRARRNRSAAQRMAKRLGADVRGTQTRGCIETKGALDLAQFQWRLTQ